MAIDDAAKLSKPSPIVLHNQGIRDVVAEDDFHNYRFLGRVENLNAYSSTYGPDFPSWSSHSKERFIAELRREGATHVFGMCVQVTQSVSNAAHDATITRSGDAYRKELR